MAESTITGGTPAPSRPAGKDLDSLGPSDSSDTGSDVQGDRHGGVLPDEEGALPTPLGSDSDAEGTGERAAADPAPIRENADILPDQIREEGV